MQIHLDTALQNAVSIADITYHLVAALALIIGGGWAYFKFIRGRTLKPRLSVKVDGTLVTDNDRPWLVVRCRAENVGLREIKVGEQGTSLRVYFHAVEGERSESPQVARLAQWQWLNSWPVFEDRNVIEPDEPLEEQLLVELPRHGFAALRLELVIHSPPENAWEVNEVVVLRPDGDNRGSEQS